LEKLVQKLMEVYGGISEMYAIITYHYTIVRYKTNVSASK